MSVSKLVARDESWIERGLSMSIFTGGLKIRDHKPKGTICEPWEVWSEMLGEPEIRAKKDSEYLTYEIKKGGTRCNKCVVGVDFLIGDIDGPGGKGEELERVDALFQKFEDAGLAYHVFASYSNGAISDPNRYKLKVWIPLDRTADPTEYKNLIKPATIELFDGLADPKALKLSQPVYAPARPKTKEAEERWVACTSPGRRAVSLDALRGNLSLSAKHSNESVALSRMAIDDVAKELKRKRSVREWGVLLEKVAAGETFADEGDRENKINTLLRFYIAPHFADATADAMASLFKPSLEKIAVRDEEGPGWVEESLELVRLRWIKNAKEFAKDRDDELGVLEKRNRVLRRAAWRFVHQTDRDTPVSPQELADLAAEEPCTREDLIDTLGIRFGKIIFFRVGDHWSRPIAREEAPAVWERVAAVWGRTRIDAPADPNEKPTLVIPQMPTFAVARSVESSIVVQRSMYNPTTAEFTEALCPMRTDLVPEYDPAVDAWLRALAGKYFPQLEIWFASLGRLDVPARILFLEGSRGLGKSLLIDGVAQLWHGNRAEISRVIGTDFNDSLTRSPLCVGEESGSGLRGEDLSRWLRKAVSDRERTLNRKFAPTTKLVGCIRFIIASNNLSLITSIKEDMAKDDVDALADRFLHIKCRKAALEALEGINTTAWVAGNAIAQHVLHLIEEYRDYQPTDRFFMGPGSSLISEVAAMATGLKGEAMSRVIKCLRDGDNPSWINFREDGVAIDPGALYEDSLLPHEQWRCSAARLGKAIGALAFKPTTMRGNRRSGHLISRKRVVLFGVESKLASRKELENAWAKIIEKTIKNNTKSDGRDGSRK